MANVIRIKRSTGSTAPATLANAELAYSEGLGRLYIGIGTGGAGGSATTVQQIGGAAAFGNASPNNFWCGPGSGATAASPTFRALVAGDLPSHSHTIAQVTGLQAHIEEIFRLSGANNVESDNTFIGINEFQGDTFFTGPVSLGGSASATTPATSDNSVKVATTAWVKAQGYVTTGGSVSSVGLALPAIFSVTGSPVTSTGTLTATLTTQPAGTVFAAPAAAGGSPGFRPLTSTDLPPHLHNIGDVQNLSNTLDDKGNLNGGNSWADHQDFTDSVTFYSTVELGGNCYATHPVVGDSSNMVATTGWVQGQGYFKATGGTISGGLTVTGDLTVNGTTVTINSTTISVDDKNIELGAVASPTDATAEGGGITLKGATDKLITWNAANGGAWTSNQNFNVATGKVFQVAGATVLSATGLGSSVVSSSLTGLGTVTTGVWSATAIAVNKGGTGATDAATARGNLGLAIGTNVQAQDAELQAIANLTSAADRLPYFTGSGTASLATFTAFGRSLVDDADSATARGTLGLGTIATQNATNVSITGGSIDGITIDGGTW